MRETTLVVVQLPEEDDSGRFSPSGFWDNTRMEEEEENQAEASTPVNEEALARDIALMAKS